MGDDKVPLSEIIHRGERYAETGGSGIPSHLQHLQPDKRLTYKRPFSVKVFDKLAGMPLWANLTIALVSVAFGIYNNGLWSLVDEAVSFASSVECLISLIPAGLFVAVRWRCLRRPGQQPVRLEVGTKRSGGFCVPSGCRMDRFFGGCVV